MTRLPLTHCKRAINTLIHSVFSFRLKPLALGEDLNFEAEDLVAKTSGAQQSSDDRFAEPQVLNVQSEEVLARSSRIGLY